MVGQSFKAEAEKVGGSEVENFLTSTIQDSFTSRGMGQAWKKIGLA